MVAVAPQGWNKMRYKRPFIKGVVGIMLLACATACSHKEKSAGQSLARVNGEEITIHQINEELARANVPDDKRDVATRQLLESLIDRQLLESEATKDKVDRDPMVMQAIERAKAQIVAQAYMQKRLAKIARPTKEEIEKYYTDHPDLFAERKVFDLDQLMIATKDLSNDLKNSFSTQKSLDDCAVWLRNHRIEFTRKSSLNSTAELPSALIKQLNEMRIGQVFALSEGQQSLIVAIKSVKNEPVTLDVAGTQIGIFLQNQKSKEAAVSEIARLRASAKIEYLNKQAAAPTDVNTAETPKKKEDGEDHVKKGVADL